MVESEVPKFVTGVAKFFAGLYAMDGGLMWCGILGGILGVILWGILYLGVLFFRRNRAKDTGDISNLKSDVGGALLGFATQPIWITGFIAGGITLPVLIIEAILLGWSVTWFSFCFFLLEAWELPFYPLWAKICWYIGFAWGIIPNSLSFHYIWKEVFKGGSSNGI
jgi:hypothetical protein